MTIKISIDCMGGDHGPAVTIPAAISFVTRESGVELALVGPSDVINGHLRRLKSTGNPRLSVVNATEMVTMDDSLEVALRRKKDSSMRVAIALVRDGHANACVSAGNTAALMALSRYLLKTIPGVDRPAICTLIPNQKDRPTYMLDLGANVDCAPHHLHQFAVMGSALVSAIEGKAKPTIGLLNIGEEPSKGNDAAVRTHQLLVDNPNIPFVGNAEGRDVLSGKFDVIVCDGFVGNVLLKFAEAVGEVVVQVLKEELVKGLQHQINDPLLQKSLQGFKQRVDHVEHGGGLLLGVAGVCIISHGSSQATSIFNAVRLAKGAIDNQVLERIRSSNRESAVEQEAVN